MTEAYEDGKYLVRVRAQVMMRDDSTGGWVPMGGGGLSNVSVRKRDITCDLEQLKHEYLIYGQRISDQTVVLSCVIKKDFEYNKVMPTFHHWKTGDRKFGLTFQTAADARAFDKGLRTAVDELLDGIVEPLPVLNKHTAEVGDDDVFMTLNLPVERGESRSSSDSSRGSRHPTPPQEQTLHGGRGPALYPPRVKLGSEHESPPSHPSHPSHADNYPYVQLTAVREDTKAAHLDTGGSLKKRSLEAMPACKKERRKGRQLCQYCQEWYVEEENQRGACEYAPDWLRTAADEVACVRCARCMVYHCMADAEGDFAQHPCECSTEDGCGRRWLGLALLSLLVPCLWLYPPLRACHWCGVLCGLCGGRHRPAS